MSAVETNKSDLATSLNQGESGPLLGNGFPYVEGKWTAGDNDGFSFCWLRVARMSMKADFVVFEPDASCSFTFTPSKASHLGMVAESSALSISVPAIL